MCFRGNSCCHFHHCGRTGHNSQDNLQQERDVQEPGSESHSAWRRPRVPLQQPGGLPEHAHRQPKGIFHLAGALTPSPPTTPHHLLKDLTWQTIMHWLRARGDSRCFGHWQWLNKVWGQQRNHVWLSLLPVRGHVQDVNISKCKMFVCVLMITFLCRSEIN